MKIVDEFFVFEISFSITRFRIDPIVKDPQNSLETRVSKERWQRSSSRDMRLMHPRLPLFPPGDRHLPVFRSGGQPFG